jgi:hypothetical protein
LGNLIPGFGIAARRMAFHQRFSLIDLRRCHLGSGGLKSDTIVCNFALFDPAFASSSVNARIAIW